MICPRCGQELTSNPCGYCGLIIQNNMVPQQGVPQQNMPQQSIPQQGMPQQGVPQQYYYQNNTYYDMPKKHKPMAIAASVLSFLGPLAIIGIVLAIVDLVTDKPKVYKHTFSVAALVVGFIILGVSYRMKDNLKDNDNVEKTVSTSGKTSETNKGSSTQKTTTSNLETTAIPEPMNTTVAIGEEFGNKTIRGSVIYANLDYKDYNDILTDVKDGYKAVYIKILVTNISDSNNYVSAGDYKCYADNIAVSAEMFNGEEESYNENIAPGRSAILGGLYIVPQGTKNIELEYKPIGESSGKQTIIIQDDSTVETVISKMEPVTKVKTSSTISGVKSIGIGDEFANKTISGVVTDVNLDYKDYNDLWTTIPEGYKAIYIVIKVTNISNESNYVSAGDYSCYVDNIATKAELITGGQEKYNENIDLGRSALLGAMYVVPKDAKSIDLEYDPIGELSDRIIIKIQ